MNPEENSELFSPVAVIFEPTATGVPPSVRWGEAAAMAGAIAKAASATRAAQIPRIFLCMRYFLSLPSHWLGWFVRSRGVPIYSALGAFHSSRRVERSGGFYMRGILHVKRQSEDPKRLDPFAARPY